MLNVSEFGKKIAEASGISRLMEDLGHALSSGRDMLMLGGGNPAHIPRVQERFRESMQKLLESGGEFERAIGNYDPPQGNKEFIEAVARLLADEFDWEIEPKNIALTNGSQSAFFILFNMFAGTFEGRTNKKILFPLAPEYIGYCDVGLEDGFVASKPEIEHISEHIFKYHIDFDRINITDEIGAICVSRPTNPTGNVLTDSEIEKLSELALANDIPLIVDNAYGTPFPNIIFTEAKPLWNEHTIVCMSLSKLGLPAARTGIVIAGEEIIDMVSRVNANMNLAPGSLGAAIATNLVRSGEIIHLSREVIRPFYEKKAGDAVQQLCDGLDGIDFHIHKPEGAFFLWLWLRGLPITDHELYERLKKRGVLIVPGHYFFPGLKAEWKHKNECIRINYAQDKEIVSAGLKIIADEVKIAYVSA
ncbi:MAG: valine--pyruvate transaminase [Phycisphaerae bacterium]|nr:valine--pyruvate transaminase [Phycisphaerae bacterium]NIR63008.1 valine--pyruvate transaminase [candidate division Zixibacteria bacterium]NIP53804.1 valine--pyruvate transaminase [Phycisphaerae bacterium]NIS50359.1 valine--pyruvate transaminase [Phycisphaerae bacterium]NIU10197.1 valine--pyruvate transaminase [Phycisphaerae bacterium]